MLIDAGSSFNPEFDLGERVVGPFLWDKKISCLDVLVLTHPHPDHLNGLPFILAKFKVREIWSNGQRVDSEAFERMAELIRQKRIPVVYPGPGWSRRISNVQVKVLHTAMKSSSREEAVSTLWHHQNNDSLVLQIIYKDQHILLPADIEADTERILLNKTISLKSHILQVPHHGSLTSSSIPFIEAVQPCFAVISERPSPRLPLPHPEVIRRYQERGVTLFRTDQDGAITFDLKKEGWKVRSFLKGANNM
jgi:competence protein ComEC